MVSLFIIGCSRNWQIKRTRDGLRKTMITSIGVSNIPIGSIVRKHLFHGEVFKKIGVKIPVGDSRQIKVTDVRPKHYELDPKIQKSDASGYSNATQSPLSFPVTVNGIVINEYYQLDVPVTYTSGYFDGPNFEASVYTNNFGLDTQNVIDGNFIDKGKVFTAKYEDVSRYLFTNYYVTFEGGDKCYRPTAEIIDMSHGDTLYIYRDDHIYISDNIDGLLSKILPYSNASWCNSILALVSCVLVGLNFYKLTA